MATPTASSGNPGNVNLGDVRYSIAQTRSTFTRVRPKCTPHDEAEQAKTEADFITLVSLICNVYRGQSNDLIAIQQFQPHVEHYEDSGHTSDVSRRAISTTAVSNVKRGQLDTRDEDIVVKRTKESVLGPRYNGLKSVVNELLIRTHPPIRSHPNIAKFRGVAWDFEDEEATKPRPLLLEELAPQGSLVAFWRDYNFVRMTFESKAELCLNIAEAIDVLHGCSVVHGDIKPENVLIFPRLDRRNAWMAKLTDFGHSTAAHEGLTMLPACTPQWAAPEVLDEHCLDFKGMASTDVYSFGLVIVSIMIGRPYYRDLKDSTNLKKDDIMFEEAMHLVEQEDRSNHDSDFDLDTVRRLLRTTIRSRVKQRSLQRCIQILHRYLATQDGRPLARAEPQTAAERPKLLGLNVSQTISVGYQTLHRCSHQLKSRVVEDLESIARNEDDPRQAAAGWELSICFFAGFGVPVSFQKCSQWLIFASQREVPVALSFCRQIHRAMGIDLRAALIESRQMPAADGLDGYRTDQLEHQDRLSYQADATPSIPGDFWVTPNEDSADSTSALNELQLPELEHTPDYPDYESEDEPDNLSTRRAILRNMLNPTIVESLAEPNLDTLRSLLESNPECLRWQDGLGNTLLVIAARQGNYEALELLLDYATTEGGIYNIYQESALHVLSHFNEQQVRTLVPALISKNADPHHEALPIRHGSDLLNLSSTLRCCPILRAILSDNFILVACLVEGMHRDGESDTCKICGGGSKLKRILAISLATFRTEALTIILEHIKAYGGKKELGLGKIEVCSSRELMPLWKLPFQNVIIQTIDLPESFFRAVCHGADHIKALQLTLSFLLENVCGASEQQLFSMLQEAVQMDIPAAVDFILEKAGTQGFRPSWWLGASKRSFRTGPLATAITRGHRAAFTRLCSSQPQLFRNIHKMLSVKVQLEGPSTPKWYRFLNAPQSLLGLAMTSAHQDMFFCNFIVREAKRGTLIKQPTHVEYQVMEEPACFLARAILCSSYRATAIVTQQIPELWQHRVYGYQWRRSRTLFNNPMITQISSSEFKRGSEFWCYLSLTVPEFILLTGSYRACRFLLERLKELRESELYPNQQWKRRNSLTTQAESGVQTGWEHCYLTSREFHCLVYGNIYHDREERQQLWELIRTQLSQGHEKSIAHLRLAIRVCNKRAVNHLLDLGWQVNGPRWLFFTTPYHYAKSLRIYDPPNGERSTVLDDKPRWGILNTHKEVFNMFLEENKKMGQSYHEELEEIANTLHSRGGRLPPRLLQAFPKGLLWLDIHDMTSFWSTIAYLLIYLVFFPLTIFYATSNHTKLFGSRNQRLGWTYVWSLTTMVTPPPFVWWYLVADSVFISEQVFCYVAAALLIVLQHIVPFCFFNSLWVLNMPSLIWLTPFLVTLGLLGIFVFIVLILPWLIYVFSLMYFFVLLTPELCLTLIYSVSGRRFQSGLLTGVIEMVSYFINSYN